MENGLTGAKNMNPPKGLPYKTENGAIYDCTGKLIAEFLHQYSIDAEYLVAAANCYDYMENHIAHLESHIEDLNSEVEELLSHKVDED